jgi:copper chaperone CopZ
MKKIFLSAMILFFAFTACNGDEENNQLTEQSSGVTEEAMTETTELTVWGMSCNRCVSKITNALFDLDGAVNVSVDLTAESVTVAHDSRLSVDAITQAITREGFNIP